MTIGVISSCRTNALAHLCDLSLGHNRALRLTACFILAEPAFWGLPRPLQPKC